MPVVQIFEDNVLAAVPESEKDPRRVVASAKVTIYRYEELTEEQLDAIGEAFDALIEVIKAQNLP